MKKKIKNEIVLSIIYVIMVFPHKTNEINRFCKVTVNICDIETLFQILRHRPSKEFALKLFLKLFKYNLFLDD